MSLLESAIAKDHANKAAYSQDVAARLPETSTRAVKYTGHNSSIGKHEGTAADGSLVRFDSSSNAGFSIGEVIEVSQPAYSETGFGDTRSR